MEDDSVKFHNIFALLRLYHSVVLTKKTFLLPSVNIVEANTLKRKKWKKKYGKQYLDRHHTTCQIMLHHVDCSEIPTANGASVNEIHSAEAITRGILGKFQHTCGQLGSKRVVNS